MNRAAFFLFLIVSLHAGLVLSSFHYYPFGFFHDDAIYWLGAKAISRGHYKFLADPGGIPLVSYPPLYPLLLTPLAQWRFAYPWTAQIFSLMLSCLGVALAGFLFLRWLPQPWGRPACLWLAMHPMLARYGSTVLSEPFFLVVTLAAVWLYWRLLESPPPNRSQRIFLSIFLGLLLGSLLLLRTVGAAFVLAVGFDLMLRRQWQRLFIVGLVCLILAGPWFFWVHQQIGHLSAHAGQWQLNAARLSFIFEQVKENLFFYVQQIALNGFFPVAPLKTSVFNVLIWGVSASLGVVGLMAVLSWQWLKTSRRFLVFFVLFYFAALLWWFRDDGRYLYPMIFILGLLAFDGLSQWSGFGPKHKIAAYLACGFLFAVSGRAQWLQSQEIRQGLNPSLPLETFQWMRTHLPAASVIAGGSAGTIYYHAGFLGMEFPRVSEPAAIMGLLKERGASHIFLEGVLMSEELDPALSSVKITNWTPYVIKAVQTTNCCRLLYHNQTEQVWIFAVK